MSTAPPVLHGLYRRPQEALDELKQPAARNYGVTLVENVDVDSQVVIARVKAASATTFSDEALEMLWPRETHSLAKSRFHFRPTILYMGRERCSR
jgi:hypothetical protein